ncbi:MAG: DUF1700 domain-containing protein [Oscillospiraceae bacterium]
MKKDEFLKELEQRLSVLNDSERRDILVEYAQHIDLKIANGMDETKATEDFGDIKTLADEILSAYNVNLKYNRPSLILKIKDELLKMRDKFLKICKKALAYLHFAWDKFTACIIRAYNTLGGFFAFHFSTFNAKQQEKSKSKEEKKENIKQEKNLNYDKKEKNMILEETKNTFNGFFHSLNALFSKGFNLFVKAMLTLFSLPFIIMTLAYLLILGIFLIFLPMGFPIIGLSVVIFGLSLCSFATAGIILSFWKKKKIEKPQQIKAAKQGEEEKSQEKETEIGG